MTGLEFTAGYDEVLGKESQYCFGMAAVWVAYTVCHMTTVSHDYDVT